MRLWNVTLSEKNTVLNAKPTANLHDSDDGMKVKISPSYSIECFKHIVLSMNKFSCVVVLTPNSTVVDKYTLMKIYEKMWKIHWLVLMKHFILK